MKTNVQVGDKSVTVEITNHKSQIVFKADHVLTESEAAMAQKEIGYHPAGYDFYGYRIEDNGTIWCCYSSCD